MDSLWAAFSAALGSPLSSLSSSPPSLKAYEDLVDDDFDMDVKIPYSLESRLGFVHDLNMSLKTVSPCLLTIYLSDVVAMRSESESGSVMIKANFHGRQIFIKAFFRQGNPNNAWEVETGVYRSVVSNLVMHTPHVILSVMDFECSLLELFSQVSNQRDFHHTLHFKGVDLLNDWPMQCLMLEYCPEAISLHRWIVDYGEAADLSTWTSILFQLFYTLECMSRVGFQHNDLHLSNILIQRAPTQDTFGLYSYSVNRYVKVPTNWSIRIYDFDRSTIAGVPDVPVNFSLTSHCTQFGQCPIRNSKLDLYSVVSSLLMFTKRNRGESEQLIHSWILKNSDLRSVMTRSPIDADGHSVPFLIRPDGHLPIDLPDNVLPPVMYWLRNLVETFGAGLLEVVERLPHDVQIETFALPDSYVWLERDIVYLRLLSNNAQQQQQQWSTIKVFLENLLVDLKGLMKNVHGVEDSKPYLMYFPLNVTNEEQLLRYIWWLLSFDSPTTHVDKDEERRMINVVLEFFNARGLPSPATVQRHQVYHTMISFAMAWTALCLIMETPYPAWLLSILVPIHKTLSSSW